MMKKAVVLLSGGLDSATCLALAKQQGFATYCLSFDYGQRHRAELAAAQRVAAALGASEQRVIDFGGAYHPKKIGTIHRYWSALNIPYELW